MGRPRIFFGNQSSRGLTLVQVAGQITRPGGGGYSHGYLSRLERGWASAPLHFYLSLAEVLAIDPGRLLGPDDCRAPAGTSIVSRHPWPRRSS